MGHRSFTGASSSKRSDTLLTTINPLFQETIQSAANSLIKTLFLLASILGGIKLDMQHVGASFSPLPPCLQLVPT